MKYTYAYKSSDGIRHEAVLEAESREKVFVQLRKQGIKAIKVTAADGSKANGDIRGVREHIVVLVAIVSMILTGVVIHFFIHKEIGNSFQSDQTRRQIIGDAAIIEKGIRTGWSDIFQSEGDRFLASFAIPGVRASVRNTSIAELQRVLKESINVSSSDTLEAKQIKAMVEGMKYEARTYLSAGGNLIEYGKRLTERQDTEIAIYKRVEDEILHAQKTMDESAFMSYLDERNAELRNLGIRPIVLLE